MNNTPNYGYNLPEYLEDADVEILNQNFTAIDKDILDVRQIVVLMYDSDEHYDTDDLVGFENPTDHHIRMFRCLEDNVTGVWDSTKWTNTNVAAELLRRSGGGTEVEANPTGTATDTLVKIRIGSTIYAVSSGATALEDLTDVDLSNLTTGQILVWDGNEWVNSDPIGGASSLSDLNDVSFTTPTEGQILKYDGDDWVNADAPDVDVTKTATGNPIEISDGADAPLVKCVTQITGLQDLHGYDKPWVGGAEKNKCPMTVDGIKALNTSGTWSSNAYTVNGVTFTIQTDADGNVIGIKANGNATANIVFMCGNYILKAGSSIKYSGSVNGSLNTFWVAYHGYPKAPDGDGTADRTSASTDWDGGLEIGISNGVSLSNQMFYPMIRLSTESDSTFEPYSNICPITAYTEGEIEVSNGDGNTTIHTTAFSQSIYQGNADFVGGEVECDMPVIDLGDLTWGVSGAIFYASITGLKRPATTGNVLNAICDSYEIVSQAAAPSRTEACISGLNWIDGIALWNSNYTTGAEVKTAMAGIKMAFELATPTTSSVTPTNLPIKSLNSYSHIESTTGDMEVEYITEGYQPIVDLISESSGGDSQHHYSTDEQVVGTWIDGSTLYEKTIKKQNISSASSSTVLIPSSELTGMNIIEIDGSYVSRTSNSTYAINAYINSDTITATWLAEDNIYYWLYWGATDTYDAYITIRYTKTSTRSLSKGTTEAEKTSSEPISEPLETKTDNLSKDETELKEEDESKEIEEITDVPEVTEEEPVDPEPSKEEEADER